MIETREETNEHFKNDLYWYLRIRGEFIFKKIARNLEFLEGEILDIGCGEANVLQYLTLSERKRYTGLDVSDYVIDKNREKYPSVRFKSRSAEPKNIDVKANVLIMCGFLFYMSFDEAKDYLEKVFKKTEANYLIACDPIHNKWSYKDLFGKDPIVFDAHLTDHDLVNGTKEFINMRQYSLVIKSDILKK